jgi:hypothetical protein
MRLRKRAAWLAVTGLVYFVVIPATRYCLRQQVVPTHIAPVKIARDVEVLFLMHDVNRTFVDAHVGDIVSSGDAVAEDAGERSSRGFQLTGVCDYSGRQNDDAAGIIVAKTLAFLLPEPLVGFQFGVWPEKYFPSPLLVKRWRFSIVAEEDVSGNSVGLPRRYRPNLNSGVPYIRSLISGEVFPSIPDSRSGEPSLPSGQSGIDHDDDKGEHPNNIVLPSVAFIFIAFGIVLLCRTWWNVCFNLSPDGDVAVYVSLVLISACLIWIDMALIGVRFGLLSHSREPQVSNPGPATAALVRVVLAGRIPSENGVVRRGEYNPLTELRGVLVAKDVFVSDRSPSMQILAVSYFYKRHFRVWNKIVHDSVDCVALMSGNCSVGSFYFWPKFFISKIVREGSGEHRGFFSDANFASGGKSSIYDRWADGKFKISLTDKVPLLIGSAADVDRKVSPHHSPIASLNSGPNVFHCIGGSGCLINVASHGSRLFTGGVYGLPQQYDLPKDETDSNTSTHHSEYRSRKVKAIKIILAGIVGIACFVAYLFFAYGKGSDKPLALLWLVVCFVLSSMSLVVVDRAVCKQEEHCKQQEVHNHSMKTPEYREGPEALENFKRLAIRDSTGSGEKEKEAD